MNKPQQKQIAEFFGVSANTIVNWGKPHAQENQDTGEISQFYPPTGRHHLVPATEMYYLLKDEDEDGITNVEKFSGLIASIIDATEMLNRTDGFDVDGNHILFSDIGKQKLQDATAQLRELQEVLGYAL